MNRKPFPRPGTKNFWGRLPVPEGGSIDRSLGTSDFKTASAILRAIESCVNSPQMRSVAFRVGKGEVSASVFYNAHQRGELAQLEARLAQPDVDLEPLVQRWQGWLNTQRGVHPSTSAKYLSQVRRLVPAGQVFVRSAFTRRCISDFLTTLGEQITATNRYRAALSSFARFLVEREVLPHNPVREVSGRRENAPRASHLSRADAQRLLSCIVNPEAKALHALMCGSGVEISAALSLKHGEINRESGEFRARGTKTVSRDRTVVVLDRFCWSIVSEWLSKHPGLPQSPVFRIGYDAARSALKDAVCAAELPAGYRSHDWRHTFAVQALKDEYSYQLVACQLGHKDASMVVRNYGKYVPSANDYGTILTERHTAPSESPANQAPIRRVG